MPYIGIFDSGVGGLGISQAVRRLLPQENIIYFADSAHFPYGEKSIPELQKLAERIVDFLIKKDCKLIVIGCNTASIAALYYLRSKFRLPIIGVVPVVKTIARTTLNRRVGILATKLTLQSGYLKALVEEFCPPEYGFKVFYQDGQELVNLFEEGNLEKAEEVLPKYLRIFKKNKVDTIALGSTHLPFLGPEIQHFMGPDVYVLDSNNAVARQVSRILTNNRQLERNPSAEYKFFVSGNEEEFRRKIENLIHFKNPQVEKVSL